MLGIKKPKINKSSTDPLVVAHEFAKSRLLSSSPVMLEEFIKHMSSMGFVDDELNKHLFGYIFVPKFKENPSYHLFSGYPNGFNMLPEAYFNLLELKELQEARINSKQAKNLSIWAILISVILSLGAIVITVSNTQDVNINEYQLNSLKQSIEKNN